MKLARLSPLGLISSAVRYFSGLRLLFRETFEGTSMMVCNVELLNVCCPPRYDVLPLISDPTLYILAKEGYYKVLSYVGGKRSKPF